VTQKLPQEEKGLECWVRDFSQLLGATAHEGRSQAGREDNYSVILKMAA